MPFPPGMPQNPDMLMASMTDPRATPQQRMAAMRMLNQGGGGQPPPQQQPPGGDGQMGMDPGFMNAVREEMMKDGQPQAAPQAVLPQGQEGAPEGQAEPESDLMDGAAEARMVSAMRRGGAVRGYAGGAAVRAEENPRISTGIDPRFMTGGRYDLSAPAEEEEAPVADLYGDYLRKRIAEGDEDAPLKSKDKWMALMQAGLGTMAAASQPGARALGSIGQGGLGAIEGLQQLRAQRAKEKMGKDALVGSLVEHDQSMADRATARLQRAEEKRLGREATERSDVRDDETKRLIAQGVKENRDAVLADARTKQEGISAAEQAEIRKRNKTFFETNEWEPTPFDPPGTTDPLAGVDMEAEKRKPRQTSLATPPKERRMLEATHNDAIAEYTDTDRNLAQMEVVLGGLLTHAGHDDALGLTLVPEIMPATDRLAFMNELKNLDSLKLITTLKSLKSSGNGSSGFGSLTEREGDFLINSLGALDTNMKEVDFDKAVVKIIDRVKEIRENNKSSFSRKYEGKYWGEEGEEEGAGDSLEDPLGLKVKRDMGYPGRG